MNEYFNQKIENIRGRIKNLDRNFNTSNGFDCCRTITNDLSYLYNKLEREGFFKNNGNIEKWKYIYVEYHNIKKRIFKKYYSFYNTQAKHKNFSSALDTIKKLEKELKIEEIDFPKETKNEFKKNMCLVKKACEYFLTSQKIKDLKKDKNYPEAIELLNHLLNSCDNSNESRKKEINNSIKATKTEYIKFVTQNNLKLLKTHSYNNIDSIIEQFENIIEEFKFEIDLNSLVSEAKKVYTISLKQKIEKKKSLNENFDEETEKLKSLKDIEELDTDITNSFLNEPNQSIESTNYKEDNHSNNLSDFNPDDISFILERTVKHYISQLNEKNKDNEDYNEGELENDILEQIKIYNEELKNIKNLDFKEWKTKNENYIKDNNYRGKVFSFFNLIYRQILLEKNKQIKFDIYPIQLISLLILTKNSQKNNKKIGKFLQINTGEGKSLIVQFFASYLALQGKKVDIITSSSVLAEKDAKDINKIKFYKKLELTVGSAKQDQYNCNIVYGDTQNFEAGILREEFKGKEVRYGRPFDCIIVDEVDSISLDNIITMTQLTDNFPGRSCFYFFYYQILLIYINYMTKELEEKGISQEKYLENPEKYNPEIKKHLMDIFKNKFLEEDGKSLKQNLKLDLNLLYPNCMKNYIENSYETWIDNVIKAPTMLEKKDFLKKDNNIIPIDFSNTGEIQSNMVWDGGLQQILQIIHDEKGTYENENTNFLSNISFFQRYKGNMFGVTGTLGGESFKHILRNVYNVGLIMYYSTTVKN